MRAKPLAAVEPLHTAPSRFAHFTISTDTSSLKQIARLHFNMSEIRLNVVL